MDVARWEQIKELFDAALERLPAERAAFLTTACGADSELRREVELLLSANAEASGFLNVPAMQLAAQHLVADEEPIQQFGSLIGQQLSHYKILSLIGAGGMGEVYLAHDTSLERRVAIKLLPLKFTQAPEHLQRFIREAKTASALNHPNIITIHEIGEFGELHFIATEFIEGVTLRQRLADGRMPLREVLNVALQVAAALEAAHNAGITHRDIKPENVMLRPDGLVKVLDFGLAKLTPQRNAVDPEAASQVQTLQTTPGLVMGTPRYMSPEQARGQKTDARSDLFSLGVMLYEMVTGAPPFPGATSAEVFAALLDKDPQPLAVFAPETPDELERIVGKALQKNAEERYQSSSKLLADLRKVEAAPEHPPSHIRATPSGNSVGKSVSEQTKSAAKPRRQRGWQAISAFLLLSVLAGAVYWLTQSKKIFGPPRITPFTTFPGAKDHACFSPDGSQIAFAWSGKDVVYRTRDIYIKVIGVGEPLQLTAGPEDDYYPAWSLDGRYIAFLRNGQAGGVYLVPALGGAARRIGDGVYTLSWSADGRTLVTCSRPAPERPNSDLMLLSVETGEAHALTQTSMPISDGTAAFSPDGKQIAFFRYFSKSAREVFTIPSGGGTPRQLTFDKRPLFGLTWTSDSREIIYSANLGGGPNLWRISAQGGAPERMNLGINPSNPAVSRLGDQLAWTENYIDTNIYRYESTGAGGGAPFKLAAPEPLILSSRDDHSPQISPDGAWIVFVSTRTGSEEIWVCDRDGGNLGQLTSFDGPPTGTPRWSPDGRWIAFDSRAGGSPDIYVISASGGAPRRLTSENTYEATPSWSSDGRWIYFASNRGGGAENIWKMPAEGGPASQVTFGGAFEGFEAADGKLFYFSKKAPTHSLWFVPVAGGDEKPVPEFAKISLGRSWGLLPQGIYFIAREDTPHPTIHFYSFATRRITTLGAVEKAPLDLHPGLALSPDGRWLLYAQRDQVINDIMRMENFR